AGLEAQPRRGCGSLDVRPLDRSGSRHAEHVRRVLRPREPRLQGRDGRPARAAGSPARGNGERGLYRGSGRVVALQLSRLGAVPDPGHSVREDSVRASVAASIALLCAASAAAQPVDLSRLPEPKNFRALRSSSNNPDWNSNDDSKRPIPGEMITLADLSGPGVVTHIWLTVADNEYGWPRLL